MESGTLNREVGFLGASIAAQWDGLDWDRGGVGDMHQCGTVGRNSQCGTVGGNGHETDTMQEQNIIRIVAYSGFLFLGVCIM